PHNRAVVLDEAWRKVPDEIEEQVLPARWQVRGHSADAKPGWVHARSGDRFNNAESALAIIEREEHRRNLSQVPRESPVPDQMADDAKQLRKHYADYLRARRHLDPGQFLNGRQIGQIVDHPAEVIDPVGIRDVAVPGLPLAHLLGAAMVEPDLGNRIDDLLAVKLQGDAQHTVRTGVLWTDVEKQEIRAVSFPAHPPLLRTEPKRLLLGILLFGRQVIRVHFRRASRVLFAQRVTRPAIGHQN